MFTVEEITLMGIYGGRSLGRKSLLQNLEKIVPLFTDEEAEMRELVVGVIKKLHVMDDDTYKKINFELALDKEIINS